jgi:hypothetical protein
MQLSVSMLQKKEAPLRTIEQVIHDSLQEWNVDEFVEIDWNTKAAVQIVKDLNTAGYVVAPASMPERAPQS